MFTIYDEQGNSIAAIPLSIRQVETLGTDGEITVIFHTPQLLRGQMGKQSGSFVLHQDGERITTANVDQLRKYATLQSAIKEAQEAK